MTTNIIRCAVLLFVAFTATQVAAKPTAYLRDNGTNFYVAIKGDPRLWNGRDAAGMQIATTADILKRVTAAVFLDGRLVATTVSAPGALDTPDSDFIIELPSGTVPPNEIPSLMVAVQSYPTGSTGTSGFSASVSNEVKVSIDMSRTGRCPTGFPLVIEFSDKTNKTEYGRRRIGFLLSHASTNYPTVQVESATAATPVEGRQLRRPADSFGNPATDEVVYLCFELTKSPPTGTFDIKFTFPPRTSPPSNVPLELRQAFLVKDVAGPTHAAAPFAADDTDVTKRSLEQNLDVAGQLGSSVVDKNVKNDAGVEVPTRMRDTKWTLDLRLAPWLNVLSIPDTGSQTFRYFTPIYIDARVSSGKITEETLALNRIEFGSEYEFRQYTNPSTYPTFFRYLLSLKNASDRDFKQAEWKGGFEFQPIFSPFNRPLRFRGTRIVTRELDTDPERAPKEIPVTMGFGWQVLPLVGVEAGKTYRNKNTFAAIEKTNFVRRVYFGATINLDLTSYVKLSIKDILYVRGEAWDEDPLHNYFKSTIEVPFPSFARNSANSAFFSFERGGQPPFSTPDANAVKVGYRVQWDGWFGQRR